MRRFILTLALALVATAAQAFESKSVQFIPARNLAVGQVYNVTIPTDAIQATFWCNSSKTGHNATYSMRTSMDGVVWRTYSSLGRTSDNASQFYNVEVPNTAWWMFSATGSQRNCTFRCFMTTRGTR